MVAAIAGTSNSANVTLNAIQAESITRGSAKSKLTMAFLRLVQRFRVCGCRRPL